MRSYNWLLIVFLLLTHVAFGQHATIKGTVINAASGASIEGAAIFIENTSYGDVSGLQGNYEIKDIKPGTYQLSVLHLGYKSQVREVNLQEGIHTFDFELIELKTELNEITVEDEEIDNGGIRRLRSIEGTAIYEAKKSEVIVLKDVTANLSTNNARQIFAKVPGLNIWESDGAGLQLGIGARGLDPNRTSNFNVRQNGYDISADALGYPESYYTPPAEAIERIEVVRGAASLQYGTQFGGLLNFVLKEGPRDKKIELTSRQSMGSFGLFNFFNSVGGTKGKVNYYSFFQHKQGDGWRPNSSFSMNTAYASLIFSPTQKWDIGAQYTYMYYLAQQPGGLTDAYFEENPRQSIRDRNWFRVNWNLMAIHTNYKFSDTWKLNVRVFGLIGGRDALGNLDHINREDDNGKRNLFVDDFTNIGAELRLVHRYTAFKNTSVLVMGSRYYRGLTYRRQGSGPDGKDANFTFLNPENLENSNYDFPGNNQALFAENIFNITPKISITPGLRFERIQTKAIGYYQDKVFRLHPITGFAEDSTFRVNESKDRMRSFLLGGVGVSFKPKDEFEVYVNFSQNYRAINFNDIRVVNPNLVVDPNIRDENGFNADIGLRGAKGNAFNYDISAFYLRYDDRIGTILKTDYETFRMYRYRTNIADSRHIGIECFGQVDIFSLINKVDNHALLMFANVAVIDAHYTKSKEAAVKGNKVELVPEYNAKAGLTWKWKTFQATLQSTFVSSQFSDASNAEYTPSAVEGIIPSYYVMDLAARYSYRSFALESGVNNLTNTMYFTRRAAGYPGPGILPSDGRAFYLTIQLKI